jgi:hypothetical protein
MRLRIFFFLVIQVVAWTIYFNAGKTNNPGSQRTLEVKEIKGEDIDGRISEIESYKLVLRNDGLFTKLNDDHITESGLWSVNYDIPSLILKSPSKEYKFKIVKYNGADLEMMLINQHEIVNVAETGRKKAELGNKKSIEKLFSSVKN